MTHPYEVLVRAAEDPTASWELMDWVRGLAGRALATGGGRVDIPEARHDDLAVDVLMKLVPQSDRIRARLEADHPELAARPLPPEAAALGARILTRYVRTMLGNAWIDVQRRTGRELMVDAEVLEREPAPSTEEAEASAGLFAAAEDVTRQALEEVRVQRGADFELVMASFEQLMALANGTPMSDFVDALLIEDPTLGADRTRARDRLYRRHRLARRYLLDAINALAARGVVPDEGILAAKAMVKSVLQRRSTERASDDGPIPSGPTVPGQGDPE